MNMNSRRARRSNGIMSRCQLGDVTNSWSGIDFMDGLRSSHTLFSLVTEIPFIPHRFLLCL